MRQALLDRFLRYVKIDTAADPKSSTYPSTQSQRDFIATLAQELIAIGLSEVEIDSHSYLTATIPATSTQENLPTIGFISHVDTSPDAPSHNVKPLVHPPYNGGAIVLPNGDAISPNDYPELQNFIGHTLITSSGDTLLGADDKAGIAEIVTAAQFLLENIQIKHPKIRLAFTCDEEIGRGVDYFDIKKFGADFAYTMDSGAIALLEYENFNAAEAKITITGRNIHPGYAAGKMINALELAHQFHAQLPAVAKPESTSGREGFFHLNALQGDVSKATLHYLIREFDDTRFAEMQALCHQIATSINNSYAPHAPINIAITEQYRNMRSKIEPQFHIVERARKAIRQVGLEPIELPIRGGTDGARLSFEGLPCPNIFTGGMNFHSKAEYASLEAMELAVRTIIEICRE